MAADSQLRLLPEPRPRSTHSTNVRLAPVPTQKTREFTTATLRRKHESAGFQAYSRCPLCDCDLHSCACPPVRNCVITRRGMRKGQPGVVPRAVWQRSFGHQFGSKAVAAARDSASAALRATARSARPLEAVEMPRDLGIVVGLGEAAQAAVEGVAVPTAKAGRLAFSDELQGYAEDCARRCRVLVADELTELHIRLGRLGDLPESSVGFVGCHAVQLSRPAPGSNAGGPR